MFGNPGLLAPGMSSRLSALGLLKLKGVSFIGPGDGKSLLKA